jgi:hypothetical protein
MFKNLVVILLSSLFIMIAVVPTVMIFLDDAVDVSIFYDASEEEKDKNQDKNKEQDLIVLSVKKSILTYDNDFEEANLEYYFKHYKKPNIKLTFPPPKAYFTI